MVETKKNRLGILKRDKATPKSVPIGPPRSKRRRAIQRNATKAHGRGGECPDSPPEDSPSEDSLSEDSLSEDSLSEDAQPPRKRRTLTRTGDTGTQDAEAHAESDAHAEAARIRALDPGPGPASSNINGRLDADAAEQAATASRAAASVFQAHQQLSRVLVDHPSLVKDLLLHGPVHQVVLEVLCGVPQPLQHCLPHRGQSHGDNEGDGIGDTSASYDHTSLQWIDETPSLLSYSPAPSCNPIPRCSPHWIGNRASSQSTHASPCPRPRANSHSKPIPDACNNAGTGFISRLVRDSLECSKHLRQAGRLKCTEVLKEARKWKQAHPGNANCPAREAPQTPCTLASFKTPPSPKAPSANPGPPALVCASACISPPSSSSPAVLSFASTSYPASTPKPYQATSSNSSNPSSSTSTLQPPQAKYPQAQRCHTSNKGKEKATKPGTPPSNGFTPSSPTALSLSSPNELGSKFSGLAYLNSAPDYRTASEDQQQLSESSAIESNSERDGESDEESGTESEDWTEDDDDLYEGLEKDNRKELVGANAPNAPNAAGLSDGDGPGEGSSKAHAEEDARKARMKERAEINIARRVTIEIDESRESDDETEPSEETLADFVSSLTSGDLDLLSCKKVIMNRGEFLCMMKLMGPCVRCRLQKVKCWWDLNDPMGECITCRQVSMDSLKTIHRNPCLRLRISDIVLYRRGGLNLTRRWEGIDMRDVGDRIGTGEIRVIYVSQGLFDVPMVMKVVKFKPKDGDVTARFWNDYSADGKVQRKKKELACYCLHDIHNTADAVEEYTIANAIPAMIAHVTRFTKNEPGAKLDVIERTYKLALQQFCKLAIKPPGVTQTLGEKVQMRVLGNLFILWFAIQHTTGSSYIVGDETLDMQPETEDPSYPLLGKVSVPRMIVAQFDNLNYTRVLEKYKNRVLNELEWLMNQSNPEWWLTIYLVLFILLREASWTSSDRYRHARENYGTKLRYSIPEFVESLQKGCNDALFYWHYYKWQRWPDRAQGLPRKRSHLAFLTRHQWSVVKQAKTHPEVVKQLSFWRKYKDGNAMASCSEGRVPVLGEYDGPQTKFDWDHPFYWIAQLFETGWYPQPTYQREPVPSFPE